MEWQTPSTLVAADASANMEMMDNRYTYMRHPILLRFYSFVGINYVKRTAQHGARGGHIDVRVSVIPVYVWWNPYNVDMTFTGADGRPLGLLLRRTPIHADHADEQLFTHAGQPN